MSKRSAAREGGLFLTPETERMASKETPQRHARTDLVDAVIGGERVLLHEPKQAPLEKAIEVRIRVALAAAGVWVKKHNIDKRSAFGTGLGIGTPDLVCIVDGRALFIEVKRPGRKPSDVQRRYMDTVRRFGAIAGVATSEAEALALVAEARRG